MKNKIILSLITIIFISSCANKFSLTKRKYTKGYYFASSSHKSSAKKENDTKAVAVKNLPSKNVTLPTTTSASAEIKKVTVAEYTKIETKSLKQKKQSAPNPGLVASADSKKPVSVKHTIKPVKEKQPYVSTSKKANDSDVKLIVLIILCFLWFFNLIAIYIHDNKKLTLNFLITLLLDFTFILGVIYSLLVILDVIDLA